MITEGMKVETTLKQRRAEMIRDCYREHVAKDLMRYGTIVDRYDYMEDGNVTVRIVSDNDGVYRIDMKDGIVRSVRNITTEWIRGPQDESRGMNILEYIEWLMDRGWPEVAAEREASLAFGYESEEE